MYQPFFNFLQLFKQLSDADEALITNALQFKKVKAGKVLLKDGAVPNEIYFITEGILKITVVKESGNAVTYFFLKENQFCTILNSFNNNTPSPQSIIAATDAQLIVFTKEKLLALYEALPYFKELLGTIMQEMLLAKIQLKNDYMGENATARYHKFITNQSDIALRVALSDVASYLGITQQSLSRIHKNK